ncbi:MAG: hypothetical protein HY297_02965 [Thaumarchaeota archaeon]|nr:hypothetical protein [Nitrososphaerota archaeon]
MDENSPVHFDVEVRKVDSPGTRSLLAFRMFALDRRGRLMIFEHKWAHAYPDSPRRDEVIGSSSRSSLTR